MPSNSKQRAYSVATPQICRYVDLSLQLQYPQATTTTTGTCVDSVSYMSNRMGTTSAADATPT